MSDDDTRPDGGTVVEGSTAKSPIGRIGKYKENELVVVAAVALGLFVFPFFLVEIMGIVAEFELALLQPLAALLFAGGFLVLIASAFVDRLFAWGILAIVAGLVVGVFSMELSIGGYEGLASLVLAFGVVVVGFNLLLGYVGLLSFGHAAFFGVAAYASALLASTVTITVPVVNVTMTMPGIGSPILMVVVGAIAATLLAWPIGFLSIRRSGVYFAVLTLTFGQMLYFYALAPGAWITGGDNGFGTGETRFEIGSMLGQFSLEATSPVPAANWIYVLAALFTLIGVAVAYRIINSPYGLIFKALGENEQRVEFVGLNVFRYKLMAFVISGTFAGVGGALFAIHEAYIHPSTTLYWITSGDFVIMNILGGVGTLVGPLFGALIFEYISNVLSGAELPVIGQVGSLWRLILGAVFVFIVWVAPNGVWGGIREGIRRVVGLVNGAVFDAGDGAVAEEMEPEQGGDD